MNSGIYFDPPNSAVHPILLHVHAVPRSGCGVWSNWIVSRRPTLSTRIVGLAAAAALATYAGSSAPSLRRYLVNGGVMGVVNPDDAPNWTLEKVSAVSKAITELITPNERVMSFWPGYVLPIQSTTVPPL